MTNFRRTQLLDFALANPLYANATVTIYGVSGGAKDTSNLVTLYDDETGTGVLLNPQKLDSDGKFAQPVYVIEPVIMQVTGARVADHDTGIARPHVDEADLVRAEHAAIQALRAMAMAENARKRAVLAGPLTTPYTRTLLNDADGTEALTTLGLGGVYSVKNIGAKGDGSTDDLSAIQGLIDGAAAGSMIFLPLGDYRLSDVLKLSGTSADRSNLTLCGVGWGSRLILDGAVEKNVLEIVAGSGFTVRNLTLVGNKGTTSPAGADLDFRNNNGLYIGGHHGATVTDVSIESVRATSCTYAGFMIGSGPVQVANQGDGVSGISLVGCRATSCEDGLAGGLQVNCSYAGCQFLNNDVYGFLIDLDSSNVSVSGCTIDGLTSAGAIGGFVFDADDVSVTGNTFLNSISGIAVDNAATGVVISGNTVSGATASGITLQNAHSATITGNTVQNCGAHGIVSKLQGFASVISGNICRNNTNHGIRIESNSFGLAVNDNVCYENGDSGISVDTVSNATFNDNVCINNNNNAGTGDGITMNDASTNLVANNLCTDVQGSKTQTYGIRTTGTSTGNTLQGNRVSGNATGEYSLVGTNTLDDFQTFTPVLEGTSSAGSGTYSAQTGHYMRVGDTVTVRGTLVWTAHTGTGNMKITGLPFASNSEAAVSIYISNLTFAATYPQGFIQASSTEITLTTVASGGAAAALAMDTAGTIIFSATYVAT